MVEGDKGLVKFEHFLFVFNVKVLIDDETVGSKVFIKHWIVAYHILEVDIFYSLKKHNEIPLGQACFMIVIWAQTKNLPSVV